MTTNWQDINDYHNKEIIDVENKYLKNFNLSTDINIYNVVNDNIIINDEDDELNTINNILLINITTFDRSNSSECNINNIKYYNPLEIIEMQYKIINYLLKYFKKNHLDSFDVYKQYLVWICDSSEYLAILIKQPVNRNKTNVLMRSSYKFCNKKSDCQSQYGFLFNKPSRGCINDHYIHNKIVSDIDNLLNYIQRNLNINSGKDVSVGNDSRTTGCTHVVLEMELRKGLETICYVINHMYQELSSFALYFSVGSNKATKAQIEDLSSNEVINLAPKCNEFKLSLSNTMDNSKQSLEFTSLTADNQSNISLNLLESKQIKIDNKNITISKSINISVDKPIKTKYSISDFYNYIQNSNNYKNY